MFILSYISMQLVEYFAWKNPENTRIPSMVGLLLISLQIPLMINAFYKGPYKNLLYAFCFVISAIALLTTKINFSMHKAPNGHLSWDWLNSFSKIYLLIFILFYLGLGIYTNDLIAFFYVFSTILFSWYTYSSAGTFGSMWCWLANLVSVYLIFKVFRKEFC